MNCWLCDALDRDFHVPLIDRSGVFGAGIRDAAGVGVGVGVDLDIALALAPPGDIAPSLHCFNQVTFPGPIRWHNHWLMRVSPPRKPE